MEKWKAFGKKLLKWGAVGLIVAIAIVRVTGASKKSKGIEAKPAIMKSDRAYAASYNFSKVTGNAASETFKVPAGNGWVYVALPAYYVATFSSATAKAGELDKLDGSKPMQFGKHTKFGDIPLAVAIRVPEGCEMTVSLISDPSLKGDPATAKVSSKKVRIIENNVRTTERKDLHASDIPSGPQIM